MPDIFRAWRWFVGLLTLALFGIFSLPKGCALRPSEEFISGIVDRAVEKFTEDMEAQMEEIQSDSIMNGDDAYDLQSQSLGDED